MTERMDGTTLVRRVMDEVTRRIASRSLPPGAKLPSIRIAAQAAGVSKSTVVEAYDRLVSDGTIASRRGSGFFVARSGAPLSLADVAPRLDRAVDPLWVSRQSLESSRHALRPGCGWLPNDWMPVGDVRRALRRIARADDGTLADYGTPMGLPALRQVLARRLGDRGIACGPDQIMLTDSATQALDLVCRLLLSPGDVVLIDDPCYFNFHAMLRAHRVRVLSVPMMPDGPDVAGFADALQRHRPIVYLTNSAVHNPTGATMSIAKAHRVLQLAEAHDMTIVEDDIFADFEEDPAPRLAALDGLARVIHVGGFSKTLSAATRCGYVAMRRDWLERLTDLSIATTFSAGRLSAELVLGVIQDGSYRRHLQTLRSRLASTRRDVAARLADVGIAPLLEPRAGMFLWCRLPDGVDSAALARTALANDMVLAPGNVFSLDQSASNLMRFNVAQSTRAGTIDQLGKLLR